MKRESKSAPNRMLAILFLAVIPLSACADVRGPTWLTGEPDETVLNAPRVVGVPSGASKKEWPSLSDVPNEKPVFSMQKDRDEHAVEMKSDLLKAKAEMERLRNIQFDERMPEASTETEAPFSFSALQP